MGVFLQLAQQHAHRVAVSALGCLQRLVVHGR
jgi:hypothetical protein